jgi:hypothetical protein
LKFILNLKKLRWRELFISLISSKPYFYSNFLSSERPLLRWSNLNNLNQFEFDFELNLTTIRTVAGACPSAPRPPLSHMIIHSHLRMLDSGRCRPPRAARPWHQSPTPSPTPPCRVAASHLPDPFSLPPTPLKGANFTTAPLFSPSPVLVPS